MADDSHVHSLTRIHIHRRINQVTASTGSREPDTKATGSYAPAVDKAAPGHARRHGVLDLVLSLG